MLISGWFLVYEREVGKILEYFPEVYLLWKMLETSNEVSVGKRREMLDILSLQGSILQIVQG